MRKIKDKIRRRLRRKMRIRKRVRGTAEKPRMSIFKSNRYVYIQVIDDNKGFTIASASNKEKELNSIKSTVKEIHQLGEAIGKRLKEKKITNVVFDRNGYRYHGVVKAVADGARKSGIIFKTALDRGRE